MPIYDNHQSDNIVNLAKALIKVQAVLEEAKKDSENPYYHSTYADLTSVWGVCRKPLSDNGLCVVQTMGYDEGHPLLIYTTLLHETGEWVRSTLSIQPVKNDPQATGSAITYGRRYSLAAIVGVCPEDDDAESATDHKPQPKPAQKPPEKQQTASTAKPDTQATRTDHWCEEHQTNYFMKGKMKGYAHPIGDTGTWCHEHREEKPPAKEEPAPVTPEEQTGAFDWAVVEDWIKEINWTKAWTGWIHANIKPCPDDLTGGLEPVMGRVSPENQQKFYDKIKEMHDLKMK